MTLRRSCALFFACSLLLVPCTLLSQQFGGHPPSFKWNQVNTDTIRVIFPQGLDSQARRVASIAHFLAKNDTSLGHSLRKVSIILQNQTTIANGYVGLGPFRSEFYLTPSPNSFDLGSMFWPDALAVHEYRHVQQFNNFRRGISKTLYYLFGEDGLALGINASVPDWFYEGDAVYHETVHSNQGRGRIPFFTNQYRSLWWSGKKYSWMKLRNGSLKDFVPSHYPLGYLLVNYGYQRYGGDFWGKVTRDAAAFKGLFYPWQKAIKTHAGIDYQTFIKEAFENYKEQHFLVDSWRSSIPVTGKNLNYVTNYMFPYQISDDSLLYVKNSYRNVPAFYIKDSSGEHRIRTKDISLEEQFSYRNGKIVYAAYERAVPWNWWDYSVIRILDIKTKKQSTLTKKSKYFTPDISPDGKKVAAVHYGTDGKSTLHVLDASNGMVLQVIKSLEIHAFADPKFIDDNSLVTAVRLNDGKMALAVATIESGVIERLTPPSHSVVGFPSVDNGIVYFTASYAGNDDIYSVNLTTKKLKRYTHDATGNYHVNARNGKLVFSSFTADGHQLRQQMPGQTSTPEIEVEQLADDPYEVGRLSEFNNAKLDQVPVQQFPISKYSKSTKLVNFHSWRPNYEDPIFTFSVYGENVLNTLQTEVYYQYHQDEGSSAVGISSTFGGILPYVSVGSQLTFALKDSVGNQLRRFHNLDTRIGVSVPLNLSGGLTFKSLNIGTNYFFRNQFNIGPNKSLFERDNLTFLQHFISWNQSSQMARQHILPRFGSALNLSHTWAITNSDAYQFFGSAALNLPGLLSNHTIVLTGAFQQRDTLTAKFSSRLANARGYVTYYDTDLGSRMWRLSANYHLPLVLPDWGFANILYLQRVRSNLFYDFQRLFTNNKQFTLDLRSTGFEVYVDTKWWNQYELTFGFRMSHLLDDDIRVGRARGSNIFEFIMPVSIIPR